MKYNRKPNKLSFQYRSLTSTQQSSFTDGYPGYHYGKYSTGGKKRILFVDDEDALIIIWKKILQNWGYEVETSADSLQALELFKANPGRFDLVISDIGMPRMPGDRLAQEIMNKKEHPDYHMHRLQ